MSDSKFKEVFGSMGPKAITKEYLNSAEGLIKRRRVYELLQTVEGSKSFRKLCEAITTSDFSYLLTADMNARLLDAWGRQPVSYPNWTRSFKTNDFKLNPLPLLDFPKRTLQQIDETSGLPRTSVGEGNFSIQTVTYADSIALSRQTIINDALGAFNRLPAGFGEAARMTAEQLATSMICDANGPHAALFNTANNNLLTVDLTYDGVRQAWTALQEQTDVYGLPINLAPKGILVPKQLELKAREIVKAVNIERYDLATEVGYKTIGQNQFAGLEVSVDPWITAISVNNPQAAKQWYMYSDPNVGRPAIGFSTLYSNPDPMIFMRVPDAQTIGGGLDPYSFEYDSFEYKVRWDIGASQIDFRPMVASKPTS
jgi:hypothetical protein